MSDSLLNLISGSPEETEAIGAALAKRIVDGGEELPRFIALYGDLGSGKTAFVRGFTSYISPKSAVRSPTFTIVNEYRGGKTPVFHFDMYRIDGEDDLYSIGFDEYVDSGICLSEWSENIGFALPEEHIRLEISRIGTDDDQLNKRSIVAEIIRE